MKKLLLLFSFVLGIFILPNPTIAQDSSWKWTPEKSMEFKAISSTTFSQDGKFVSYVVREAVMEGEKSEYLQQVWVAATDGSFNVQYTHNDKSSFSPAFSPNGDRLAFLSGREGKTQIWMMRLMGGEPIAISSDEQSISRFKWSPDGKHIAFVMRDEDTEDEKKAKKEKRYVTLVDQDFKYNHLYTLSTTADEKGEYNVQRLTRGEFNITSFDWAPDGSKIVFAHQPDPKIATRFLESDISWVAADSGSVVGLVKRPGVDRNPIFSPDGQTVAFESSGGSAQPVGLIDLFTVDANGGIPSPLAQTFNRNSFLLAWSPDNKQVYYTEPEGTASRIFSLDVKKKKRAITALTPGDGVASSAAFAPNGGQMAYIWQTTDTPAELFLWAMNEEKATQITQVNEAVEIPEMGKTRKIRWTSKDGLDIEGLLTYPVNYVEGNQYPLILQIHGGPAGVFSESFTGNPSIYLTQYFAERGYAIIRPNPRGSTGYGRDFRFANVKDWGFGDYEDVMSGVDKAIEMGVADPERLLLMGWSYGGYMTSFVVTRTDRFKAASMGAGLPNLISMVTTTDIPDYLAAHMGGEYWNDYETYEKHSAIYRIKEVKTPTQVIHGAQDLRVPTNQGQEFYVSLKRLGVPTEMILLPRTPHGPREPKLQMEVSPRILAWFEKHLGEKEKMKR